MARNICQICGKDIVGFIECQHYDYKDFPLEIALGELILDTNEYDAAIETAPYSRHLVEREAAEGSFIDEISGISFFQRLAFLNNEKDKMPPPLFLRM